MKINAFLVYTLYSVADLDLQISGGGGGHPDPWSKNKGGVGGGRVSPGSDTETVHYKWCLDKSVGQSENDLERGFV